MKNFAVSILAIFAALSGGVLVRYAQVQIAAPIVPQTAQVAAPFNAQPRNWNSLRGEPYTLIFVGDLMLSRGVAYQIKKHGNDFTYPFEKIADTLRSADLAFGNLEGPISSRGTNQGSIYSFRADPRVIEGLTFAGFDALSLANNHIFDWGKFAVEDTINLLRKNNIRPVGAGMNYDDANAARVVAIGDLRLAIFAYTNLYPKTLWANGGVGISEFDPEKIRDRIRAIRENVDIIIVSLHWGEEYAPHPSEYQKEIAHALVDAGADIIVGHHPHVVQEVERYNGGWIAYSLGNFVFDQNFSERTRRGAIARVTVRGKKITGIELISVRINDTFQPALIAP